MPSLPPESEALLELGLPRGLELIPHPAFLAAAGGQVAWVNRRWEEETGQPWAGEPHPWSGAAVHPDDREGMSSAYLRAVQGLQPLEHRCRVRRRDGAYRWSLVRADPAVEDGRVVAWVGTLTDVQDLLGHEAALAEERLRASEAHYQRAMRDSGLVAARVDRELRYTWVYNPHPDFLPADVLGSRDDELAVNEGTRRLMALKRGVLETGRPAREQIAFPLSGGLRVYDVRAEPFLGPGGVVEGLTTVALDVTERHRAEERVLRLQQVTASFNETQTLSEVRQVVVREIPGALGADGCTIRVVREGRLVPDELFPSALPGEQGPRPLEPLPPDPPAPAADVARSGQAVFLRDAEDRGRRYPAFARRRAQEQAQASAHLPLERGDEVFGVLSLDFAGPHPWDEAERAFALVLADRAAIAYERARLFEELQESNAELALAYDATIEGWSKVLDLRDKETEGHSLRVTELTLRLARAMGMREEDLVHVRRGALLHDIGKMGVPDDILRKPGPLTPEEWEVMRRHPTHAFEMLYPITYLRPALEIPYCHHERWDGSGYPRGLKGEEIPLAARMFTVVDVYDALTSDRPYWPAWTREKALEHVRAQAGSHFDPAVVEAFLWMMGAGGAGAAHA